MEKIFVNDGGVLAMLEIEYRSDRRQFCFLFTFPPRAEYLHEEHEHAYIQAAV